MIKINNMTKELVFEKIKELYEKNNREISCSKLFQLVSKDFNCSMSLIKCRYGNFNDILKELSINIPKNYQIIMKSKELKDKISKANKGRKWSLEARNRQSIRLSGFGNGMYGKKHSEETRKKIRNMLHSPIINNKLRDNISKAQKGKKLSEEHKKAIKDACNRPEIKKKISDGVKNSKHSEIMRSKEVRDKISLSIRGEKNPSYGKPSYPKPIYDDRLNHFVRSKWELNVCLLLKQNNIGYDYEPEFFKLGDCSYTPDIKIDDNTYIEVKGPLYDWQLDKMKKFIEIYNKKLIIVTGKGNFKRLSEFILVDYDNELDKLLEIIKR